jgi:hypothetical protein
MRLPRIYATPGARSRFDTWPAPRSARRVRKIVAYTSLSDMSGRRREFHEALLEADSLEDLPGKWQAAILKAEQNRPNLRIVGNG